MPCERLWQRRNIFRPRFHVQKKEMQGKDTTSKRLWVLRMTRRHIRHIRPPSSESPQYYCIPIFKMLMIAALCTGPGCSSWARLFSNVVPPTQRRHQQDHWSGMSLSLLKLIFFLRILYSLGTSASQLFQAVPTWLGH
jgi:hypothetical protein